MVFVNAALGSPAADPATLPLRKALLDALGSEFLDAIAVLEHRHVAYGTLLGEQVVRFKREMKALLAPVKPAAPPPPPRAVAPPPPPPPPKPTGPPRKWTGPKPAVKMKQLHWETVPEMRVFGSFWDRRQIPKFLDYSELEKLFAAAVAKPKVAGGFNTKRIVGLLDSKRSMQVGVIMARLPVSTPRIHFAVLSLDAALCGSAEDVANLLKCVPTEDEEKLFLAKLCMPDAESLMSEADRFVVELLKVPRVGDRLTVLSQSFSARTELLEVVSILRAYLAACKEVRASRCLATTLAVVLGAGNFLNCGSRLGNAAGFRFSILRKLESTRASLAGANLCTWVVRSVLNNARHLPRLADELPSVLSPLLDTPLADTSERLERVAGGTRDMARAAKAAAVRSSSRPVEMALEVVVAEEGGSEVARVRLAVDRFESAMDARLRELEREVDAARDLQAEAAAAFDDTLTYFGDNSQAVSAREFWPALRAFVEQYTPVSKAVEQERRQEEERKERMSRQRTTAIVKKWSAKATALSAATDPDESAADAVLEGVVAGVVSESASAHRR